MKEAAYICDNVTSKSLVLIDELGRATSNEDGVAIAWAVAEHLLLNNAITFFVTHYNGLSRLQELYENVSNISFGRLEKVGDDDGNCESKIIYDHKVYHNPCQVGSSYGINMAQVCGWNPTVVAKATAIREYIVTKISGDGGVNLDVGMCKEEMDAKKHLVEIARAIASLVQDHGEGLTLDAKRDFLSGILRKAGLARASESLGDKSDFDEAKSNDGSVTSSCEEMDIAESEVNKNSALTVMRRLLVKEIACSVD